MREKLFQFIWLFRHYNASGLTTIDGQKIEVIHPGQWNEHQGPDFLQAKIYIDTILMVGSVELHLRSGDWQRHDHDKSKHYDNVILHVVHTYEGKDLQNIPTLVLGDRIAHSLVDRYNHFMQSSTFIPCSVMMADVQTIIGQSWLERMLMERMTNKYQHIQSLCTSYRYHWNHISWHMITSKFAPGINSDAFELLANALPYTKIWREHSVPLRVEAMVMGMSGFLSVNYHDQFPVMLQREFDFLQRKYQLKPIRSNMSHLRMRPANFPGIRLSQLAALMCKIPNIFNAIQNITDWKEMIPLLQVDAHDYWHYHYKFDQPATFSTKPLGQQMIYHLIVNAFIPLLFAYASINKNQSLLQRVVSWLHNMSAEQNQIIRHFANIGLRATNAGEAQALLHLKKEYCDAKKCLDCAVGASILKRTSSP